MLQKIISGGQTGADRAALDVAIEFDISHCGWIPKGRKTEDCILPDKYQLQEMPTASYPKRTEKNILDSDGTLILAHGRLSGGSSLTLKIAKQHHRPRLHVGLNKTTEFEAAQLIHSWIVRPGDRGSERGRRTGTGQPINRRVNWIIFSKGNMLVNASGMISPFRDRKTKLRYLYPIQ